MSVIKTTGTKNIGRWGAVAAAVWALLAVILFCRSASLDRAQKNLIALLDEQKGNYNEDRIVLSPKSREQAQAMADTFGGSLRITTDGSFAVIDLPEGVTLSDIAQNRSYRQYHDEIRLDYTHFKVAEAEEGGTPVRDQTMEPMYPQQTYLEYLNIGDTWNVTRGANQDGEKVLVAVIDTGIDTDHPEFQRADGTSVISSKSYDSTNDKTVEQYGIDVIEDSNGHGTGVAGVIAAQMNGVGTVGIAPDVELLVIKCDADENGEFKSSADIVFAIYYAVEQDADVINMSLGGGHSPEMKRALQLAVDSDILCIASAGNDATDDKHFPSAYDTVIGVGALAADSWEIANYSNYGINSDLMAPGTALTASAGGGYAFATGTSISAPMVSAAVAMYLSQNRYVAYQDLREELLAACTDLGVPGEDLYYGYGALDIHAFVRENKGLITYDYCTEDLASTTQVFVQQHTIQTVPEPERTNVVFDDWYFDKAYTRVFDYDAWYTTPFVENVTLYAKWVNEDDEDASAYELSTLPDGTLEIVRYKGKRRYLTIPNEMDGKRVSSIGEAAFAGNTRLREVAFPEGLVRIKKSAFQSVTKLRSVSFTGRQLTEIGEAAFQACTSLRSLDLPDSVQRIEKEAFSGCSSLNVVNISRNSTLTGMGELAFSGTGITRIFLPKGVSRDGMDGNPFAFCRKLTEISLHDQNTALAVFENGLYTADGSVLVCYPAGLTGSCTIREGAAVIESYAFGGSAVSSVIMPDTVLEMGESAFQQASVAEILLSGQLGQIPDSAFAGAALKAVHIPAKVESVGEYAFQGCLNLQQLTFAEDAETVVIGKQAFENCGRLERVTFPQALQRIGEKAFYSCVSLRKLTIPSQVSSMDTLAFGYCSGIEQLDFAQDCVLTKIPRGCFAGCTALTTVNFSDGILELGQDAFANDHMLTSLHFGQESALRTVGDFCFYACSALQEMQLPDGVTSIGAQAYAFCGLKQVQISANVQLIGNGAFGACFGLEQILVDGNNATYAVLDNVLFDKNITEVFCVPASRVGSYTLPETVRITAPYSFYYDRYLTTVILPEGLTDIQQNSFYHCTGLTAMEIPASVVNIGREAFENCYKLKSLTFGKGSELKRLGFDTFVGCGFTEITIPASVNSLAQYAFSDCPNLKRITFEKNSQLTYVASYVFSGTEVESIVFEEGSALQRIQAHAFDGAASLQTVDFGDASLTTVDNYAFYNCRRLSSIRLPDTVTYLGRYVFFGCELLDQISVPAAMDFIGQAAFLGTNQIKVFFAADRLPANLEQDWDKGIAGYFLDTVEYVVTDEWEYAVNRNHGIALALYKGPAAELDIDVIDGYPVEQIGTRCFYDNDRLTNVTLGSHIREIGNYAFADCGSLQQLLIPASVKRVGKYAFADSTAVVTFAEGSALEEIDDYAFSRSRTAELTLPDSVTAIGEGAFSDSSLTTLAIGNRSALKTIGLRAFVGSHLTSVFLPASLETVGAEAFRGVSALSEVTIASGNTGLKLSNSAFEGSGVSELTLPARVNYIGEFAFAGCTNLQKIDVAPGNPVYTSLDGVLCNADGTTLIQYPCGRSGAYEVPARIRVLTYASFKDAKQLTNVTFAPGSSVRTIGWRTFSGCENLTSIVIPDSVISFDFYAFENCTSLTEVLLGAESGLTGVYEGAFYHCTALSGLRLPDTVTEIGEYAFCDCTSLAEFPLSETSQVKGIYEYAFYRCTNLSSIPAFARLEEIGEYAFAYTNVAEYIVPASVKNIASTAFSGCERFAVIGCDEENDNYCALNGALYEKGTTDPSEYDALVIWPYGTTLFLGDGKSELTVNDTQILRSCPDIRWEIADTVEVIGEYAFKQCSELAFVVVPESVHTIRYGAFYGCSRLTILFEGSELPETLEEWWDAGRPYVCGFDRFGVTGEGFSYVITGDGQGMITCVQNKARSVVLPGTVEGAAVTRIHPRLFQDDCLLREVVLPDTLTEIPERAFWNCQELTSIRIPAGVVSIGKQAFGTSGLETVSFAQESQCETIGEKAFSWCRALRDVTIPEKVAVMESGAFEGCVALETIRYRATEIQELKEGNQAFVFAGRSSDGISVQIAGNVRKIPGHLFDSVGRSQDNPNITRVVFEENSQCRWIAEAAFANLSGLKSVVIPASVTRIGDRAFKGCPALTILMEANTLPDTLGSEWNGTAAVYLNAKQTGTLLSGLEYILCADNTAAVLGFGGGDEELVIPETILGVPVTEIANSAFEGNQTLVTVSIPNTVTKLGAGSFSGCKKLASVLIPDSVAEIGEKAFYECDRLTILVDAATLPETLGNEWNRGAVVAVDVDHFGQTEDGMNYWITGKGTAVVGRYTGTQNSVTLPETLEGRPVTEIADSAFYGNTTLTTVSVPETLEVWGAYSFDGCTGLNAVTIPEGTRRIGHHAFNECTALVTVDFRARQMEDLAYNNRVFSYAGVECPGLVLTIGRNCLRVPAYLFYSDDVSPDRARNNLIAVRFADGAVCESIGQGAFNECHNVTELRLPEGVVSLESSSLSGLGITSLELPSTVRTIGEYALAYCDRLETLTLNEGLLEIGARAFVSDKNLRSIVIPDSVTTIGSNAFGFCTSLPYILIAGDSLPENAASDWNAGITVLMNVVSQSTTEDGYEIAVRKDGTAVVLRYSGDAASVSIPSEAEGCPVTEIAKGAFQNHTEIRQLSIPESIAVFGDSAFDGCTGLEEINYLARNAADLKEYNYVFRNAGKEGSGIVLNIGAEVESIPRNAFCPAYTDYGNDDLASTEYPRISRIVFEEGGVCSRIGYAAFAYCASLKEAVLPETVGTVGTDAFTGCYNLMLVMSAQQYDAFGRSLSAAGAAVCADPVRTGVTEDGFAYYVTQEEQVVVGQYWGTNENLVIPAEIEGLPVTGLSQGLFYTSPSTEKFSVVSVVIPQGITEIGDRMFYSCDKLVSVSVPGTVTRIGAEAFSGCCRLEQITLPDSLAEIGNGAFMRCSNLQEIGIPDTVTSIGQNVFYQCSKLARVKLPAGIREIPAGAFEGSALEECILPDTVTTIEASAFASCKKLTRLSVPSSVNSIGSGAFASAGLKELYYNAACLKNFDSWNQAFYKAGQASGGIHLVIGPEVTRIPAYFMDPTDNASDAPEIASITFADDGALDSIGKQAFAYCVSLTDIAIPGSVSRVEENAFLQCTGLQCVRIDSPAVAASIVTAADGGGCCSYANSVAIPADFTETGAYLVSHFTETEEIQLEGKAYVTYSDHGHQWEFLSSEEFIECQQDGRAVYGCTVCGQQKTETLPAHDLQHYDGQPAGCTQAGWQAYDVCRRCGASTYQEIPAVGHTWDEGVVTAEPTEEAEGETTYTCTVCGETRTEPVPPLDHVHRYEDTVTEPTCTEPGYTTHTCAGCGDSYTDSETQALGHAFGEWIVDKEASCVEEGEQHRSCSRCDAEEWQTISVVDHTWDEGVVTVEPTEETEGETTYTCTVCGETRTESVPPLSHVHRYEDTVTEPTCTEPGCTTHICAGCGDSYTDSETQALGHAFGEWIVDKEASCVEDGGQHRSCSRCGAEEQQTVPAPGHLFGEWIVTKEPTNRQDGERHRDCLRCGASETEVLEAAGQEYTMEEGTLSGFEETTSARELVRDLNRMTGVSDVTVTNAKGAVLSEDAALGTGCRVTYRQEGEETPVEMVLILYGDVDGNAGIDLDDVISMRRHLLHIQSLDGVYRQAAMPVKNSSGEPSLDDVILVRRYLLHIVDKVS